LMYGHRTRSYKELPIRYADFGVLHRNELSGALSGLTRVRKFQQDDAHIFCTPQQIREEISSCLDFMKHVYGIFGFEFQVELSTRPEKYMGEIEAWNSAEKELAKALDEFGQPWKLNSGDGAFYGPKIDVRISDAMNRTHQCATIQLDFQLPLRFGLEYTTAENVLASPVIIHRAILGSLERMMAVLIEHTAGKWPFWTSPRQCIVIPLNEKVIGYASEVHSRIKEAGFYVDIEDASGRTLQKKIREAQLLQYNFILVVGEEELQSKTVNVRTRDNQVHGPSSVEDLVHTFQTLTNQFK